MAEKLLPSHCDEKIQTWLEITAYPCVANVQNGRLHVNKHRINQIQWVNSSDEESRSE